jgi:hypothetical protein
MRVASSLPIAAVQHVTIQDDVPAWLLRTAACDR